MNFSPERSVTAPRSPSRSGWFRALSGALAVTAALAACGSAGRRPASLTTGTQATVPPTFNPEGSIVFSRDVHGWYIECNGPLTPHKALSGDTIISLAHSSGTFLRDSASLDEKDVSAAAWGQALADINGLKNENRIIAGDSYEMPTACDETNDPNVS